ncbi:amidohydrolase family protein [Pseudonocardia sp. HH130629-09]|uniref:amidohydrolase family protein n=1 Tax=Pseudonocardia sp. HH130629-09 TaxID=1641402 RepID=UPI0007611EA4|nr:amidohydrolase family protein [Pseudonocardia sp. HH130629-09]
MDDLFATTTRYRALANPTVMDNILRAVGALHDTATLTSTTAPDHRLPLVATRDIAAAAHLLLDRTWSGFAETPLLGPEDLSGNDMAAVLSDVLADLLGRPVRYTQTDPEVGIDRIIWSTDYRFLHLDGTQEFLSGLDLSHGEREQITHGNAARLLGL